MVKKQHYVPRFVLKNFCIDGEQNRCWEYNLYNKKYSKKLITEICAKEYLYEIRNESREFIDPKGVNNLENALGKIETQYAPFLNSLCDEIRNKQHIILESNDREAICAWIALMIMRNPTVKKAIPDTSREFGYNINQYEETDIMFNTTITKLSEIIKNDLLKGKICFLEAYKGDSFIISDIPVVFKGSPIHELCFTTLSPRCGLLFYKSQNVLDNLNKCDKRILSEEETIAYNCRIYNIMINSFNSDLKTGGSVISNNEETLKKAVMNAYQYPI